MLHHTFLIAAVLSLQDPDLSSIITRMAERSAQIDALEWRVRTWYGGRDYTDRGNYALGRFVRDRGLRLEVTIVTCSEPLEHRPEQAPNRFALVWTPDQVTAALGLVLLEERTGRGAPHTLVRARKDDPVLQATDPLFLFSPLPVLFVMNAPALCFTLDPRLMLSYEPSLTLAGRGKFADRDCYRLISRRLLGAFTEKTLPPWYRVLKQEKTIFVNTETYLVEGISYAQLLRREQEDVPVNLTSTVLRRAENGLPLEILTIVEEPDVQPPHFRQLIEYDPASPHGDQIEGYDARSSDPAGPLLLTDQDPPAGDADAKAALSAHLARANRRSMRLIGETPSFDSPQQEEELVEAWKQIAALAVDGGTALANLHWYARVQRRSDLAAEVIKRALALPSLAPMATAYFSRALLEEGKPEVSLRLSESFAAPHDPYLRTQISIDRVSAWLHLGRVPEAIHEFENTLSSQNTFSDRLHYLRHMEEVGARLRQDPKIQALGKAIEEGLEDLVPDVSVTIARAAWSGWADHPDEERSQYEAAGRSHPTDPYVRHLAMRCAWRQLATAHPPQLSTRLNYKLGPVGDARRFEPAATNAAKSSARAWAELIRPWAEEAGADPRPAFLVGLASLRAGDEEGAIRAYTRALELASNVPQDPIRLVAAGRIYSEIAQFAMLRRRLDLLERSTKLWIDSTARSGWPDADILSDEVRNPVWLCSIAFLERKEYAKMWRLSSTDPHFAGPGITLRQRLRDVRPRDIANAVIAEIGREGAPELFLQLSAWILQFYPLSDDVYIAAAEALEQSTRPSADLLIQRARLRAAVKHWERAFDAARFALKMRPDDEAFTLYAARLTVLMSAPEKGLALLTQFISCHEPKRIVHFGMAAEELGAYEQALAYYETAIRAGEKPYLLAARLHFRAQRWDDALRYYNRVLRDENAIPGWPEWEMLPIAPGLLELPTTAAEGRALILVHLGENAYIDRLLKEPLSLTPEESTRIQTLLKKLQTGNESERADAIRELGALDRNAALLVFPLLQSPDASISQAARELLNGWAEPR